MESRRQPATSGPAPAPVSKSSRAGAAGEANSASGSGASSIVQGASELVHSGSVVLRDVLEWALPAGRQLADTVLSSARRALTADGWRGDAVPASFAVVLGASSIVISTVWMVSVSYSAPALLRARKCCTRSPRPLQRRGGGNARPELRDDVFKKSSAVEGKGKVDPRQDARVTTQIPLAVLRG